MSALRKIPQTFFKILIIILAIGLGFWQYRLVAGGAAKPRHTIAPVELQFKMNDGRTVSVPNDTTKYSVVVFWTQNSDRSIAMVRELLQAFESHEYDTIFNFYAVNLNDTPESMRLAVEFDNTSLPFAYDAEGMFLARFQIRTLPLTVFFTTTGAVFSTLEGYEEGELKRKLENLVEARKYIGPSGEFKFEVN